jgi:uncharacterized repeat protein (TIGR02543 family)
MKNGSFHKFVAILALTSISSIAFSNSAYATVNVRWHENKTNTVNFVTEACTSTMKNMSRSGYLFAGWNTQSNGTGTGYAPGSSCDPLTDMIRLYAQWIPTRTLTFIDPISTTSTTQTETDTATLNLNTFTREGFTFAGWNTAADGTGTPYSDQASYSFSSHLTLYAQWTVNAVSSSGNESEAAAKAAAEARAREVEVAKTQIKSVLSSGKPLTVDQLLKADINGVTAKNIDLVNADIAKLSEDQKTGIAAVEKVVFKFATVDKVANHSPLSMRDLASVGLVSAESKYKGSISIALKSLPSESLDTYEKISAAVAAVEKKYADRKAALAALKSRIKTGPKAG